MPTVLLVDDDADLRMLARVHLTKDPSVTIIGEAADGAQALKQVAALRPDAVVLDLEMPVMDGLTALWLIRALEPETRVVIWSAHADPANVEQRGAAAVLGKDCHGPELLQAVTGEPVPAGSGYARSRAHR